jgi:formate dehydrogenase maturation protein FdhE
MMAEWWDKQIQRADHLAGEANGSKALLTFYAYLLRAQREMYESWRSRRDWLPTGAVESDLPVISEELRLLLSTIHQHGPDTLAAEALKLSESDPHTISEILLNYWYSPSDTQFFGKACLQPYLRWLLATGARPVGRERTGAEYCCPICGGRPQVSFLQSKEINSESGNRDLICATCLSSWEFRRVVCANCGEEEPSRLGYFQSPQWDHVRIEACDTCKHYIKGIDLTRLGLAAPIVDEIDAAPLDLWATEHGYTKIELNLVGL